MPTQGLFLSLYFSIIQGFVSQSVVPGPRTSASPGKLEMPLLRPQPELLNQTFQGWGPAYVFEQALEVMLG